jgi:hypothetical protein
MTSLIDDEFVVDKIERKKYDFDSIKSAATRALQTLQKREQKMMSYKFSSISAFGTCWPYICFSGLGPYMLISNVFDREHLHRIQIGEEGKSCKICNSFISDTKDLFVMTLKDSKYMMYMLDLDKLNFFKNNKDVHFEFELMFQYDDEFVHSRELKDIHVRGSSRKEVIQLNQKLIVFMLHDEHIYSWIDLREGEQTETNNNNIRSVNRTHEHVTSTSFQIVDNNLFYYQSELRNPNDDNVQ